MSNHVSQPGLAVAGVEPLERETVRRVAWRLIPLLMLGYFCAYLDRVNVGFAGLTMNKALGFSSAVFGFGGGVFFIGYLLAELPSNLILARVGARRWIARILLTWGIISGLTAFVWNDWSFYGIRFLLGLAEAGFYPGIVLYLTWWFPSHYRSRMMAFFQSASVISLIIGPPVSAWLLTLDGTLGLQGWQWLFLIEALPPIIMCFVIWFSLTDRPRDAAWLRPEQRDWLQQRLDAEQAHRESVHDYRLGEALANPKVWLLTLVYFGQNVSNYGLLLFLPQIIKSFGISTQMTGFVSALPFVFAAVAMIYWGFRSDRTGNRTLYVAAACVLCAAGPGGVHLHRHRAPGVDDGGAGAGDHGPAVDCADVLAAAHGDAVRGCRGGRDRVDQFGGQSGRISGAVYVWPDQGRDGRQRSAGAACVGGGASDLGGGAGRAGA